MKFLLIKKHFVTMLSLVIAIFALLISFPAISQANGLESELETLYKNLENTNFQLLEQELSHDALLIKRMKFDGMGGWFSGSKKKKIEREMASSDTEINRNAGEVQELQKQIQGKIYQIAEAYQNSGDYSSAIKWYLRLETRTEKVKFNIAGCYKLLENYKKAVEWLKAMSQNDNIKFEISDCYRLDGDHVNEITYLFKVVEPYQFTSIDNQALKRLEKMDFSNKLSHFPKYYLRIHKVFMTMTFKAYSTSITKVNAPYTKAVEYFALHYSISDNASASRKIVDLYYQKFQKAQDDYSYQTKQADEYYLRKLHEAEHRMNRARREFDDQMNEARRKYDHELQALRDKVRHWEKKVKELQSQTPPATPEEIASAEKWIHHYKRELDNFNTSYGRDRFIQNYTADAERRMKRSRREYDDVIRNRSNIISEYLSPYKAILRDAKAEYDKMNSIHSQVFGG